MRSRCVFVSTAKCAVLYHGYPLPRSCRLAQPEKLYSGGRDLRGFRHMPMRGFDSSRPAPGWHAGPPQPPSIHPRSSGSTALPLSEQLRSLMRLLTHSVVVCTSAFPEAGGASGPPHAQPRAMTMSSFTSLALRPAPAVTFNIATPSRTLDAIRASRRFNIHVLAGDAAGARVAEWFTKGNADGDGAFEGLEGCGCELLERNPTGPGGGSADLGPPTLDGPGVLYVLRCKLMDEPSGGLVKVRDHVIVLGEVLEIEEGRTKGEGEDEDRFGLIYADRRYRQLGKTLMHERDEDS